VIGGKIPSFHFYRGQRVIPWFLDEVLSGLYVAAENKFTAIRLPVLNAWFFLIDTDTIRRFEGQRGINIACILVAVTVIVRSTESRARRPLSGADYLC